MAAPSLVTRSVNKAKYEVHHKVLLGVEPVWRYVLNGPSTRAFRKAGSGLSEEAARVLRDLNRDGCALSTVEALTGDPTLLGRLQAEAKEREAERADEIAEKTKALQEIDLGDGNSKPYLVQFLDAERPVVEPDGLLATTALQPGIKAIADAYYGMNVRVADINIWRNLPSHQAPVSSQLWHRDQPDDYLVLKMFIYLEDVTDGAGPLSYVKGTHGKGDRKWRPAGTIFDGHNIRVHDADMDREVPSARRPRFTGPAGTVVLSDTRGWHKGGQATDTPRLLVQVLFASRAAADHRMLGTPKGLDLATVTPDLAYDKTSVG
jgi:Phytanoyl-CoA dioxygenase (PhyH)